MMYKIIEKIDDALRERIKAGESVSGEYYFPHEEIFLEFAALLGVEKPNIYRGWMAEEVKNNSSAEIFRGVSVRVQFDGINYLDPADTRLTIKFNGEYLFRSYGRGNSTRELYLLNDPRDICKFRLKMESWEKEHPAPNKVGTLTDKKLAEWLDWLNARNAYYDSVKQQREDNVKSFFDTLNEPVFDGCEKKLGEKRGYVEKGYFRLNYEISDDMLITTKVELLKYKWKDFNYIEFFKELIS